MSNEIPPDHHRTNPSLKPEHAEEAERRARAEGSTLTELLHRVLAWKWEQLKTRSQDNDRDDDFDNPCPV